MTNRPITLERFILTIPT